MKVVLKRQLKFINFIWSPWRMDTKMTLAHAVSKKASIKQIEVIVANERPYLQHQSMTSLATEKEMTFVGMPSGDGDLVVVGSCYLRLLRGGQ